MAMWNPWRGCHKVDVGCKTCYIHQGDKKRKVDTNLIVKLPSFTSPLDKNKNGSYKVKSGSTVFTCFSSDFLLEEADRWREECWEIIKERNDLHFVFLTKRIGRFKLVKPEDWGQGYDNVTIGVSVSNQETVDKNLSILKLSPIKHKNIILQPLINEVNIEPYLDDCELVIVGGEYGKEARPLNFDWVLDIRDQCVKHNVNFEFRQCGTYFIKDGEEYTLNYRMLSAQAKKADINYQAK